VVGVGRGVATADGEAAGETEVVAGRLGDAERPAADGTAIVDGSGDDTTPSASAETALPQPATAIAISRVTSAGVDRRGAGVGWRVVGMVPGKLSGAHKGTLDDDTRRRQPRICGL
jgi:hypothetical protein